MAYKKRKSQGKTSRGGGCRCKSPHLVKLGGRDGQLKMTGCRHCGKIWNSKRVLIGKGL